MANVQAAKSLDWLAAGVAGNTSKMAAVSIRPLFAGVGLGELMEE